MEPKGRRAKSLELRALADLLRLSADGYIDELALMDRKNCFAILGTAKMATPISRRCLNIKMAGPQNLPREDFEGWILHIALL